VLTVAESGELLGISRAFAYELVVRGERPVIRLGRRIVVPKAAVLAYATGVQRLAGATQSGESVPMENMTDELCSMTVVPVAVGVTAHDPVARFVPVSRYLARLGRRPVLVVDHDGLQVAVLTGWTGFDLVDDLRLHYRNAMALIARQSTPTPTPPPLLPSQPAISRRSGVVVPPHLAH
jgi:excisionase family DNA binding protein